MEYFASQDPRSYSFYFDSNIWFRAQKSYRDFQETGPWASLLRAADAFRVTWSERGPVVRLGYVTEMHWPRRPGKSRMTRFWDYESLQSKPFNRCGKHDGIKGKNFSSRNRLSFLKFWDRSSALWHLKKVFHVISFHFDLSILVVDESYFSLLCLGLRP